MLIVASKTSERHERDGVLQHSAIPHACAPVVELSKSNRGGQPEDGCSNERRDGGAQV